MYTQHTIHYIHIQSLSSQGTKMEPSSGTCFVINPFNSNKHLSA